MSELDASGFEVPSEIAELKAAARRFVDRSVNPRWQEIERSERIPADIVEGVRELGLFGMLIPEEYGGLGLTIQAYTEVLMELGRAHGCILELISGNNSLASRAIVLDGTEEQKRRYLPRIASGEILCAFALTEPGAGSDAQAITTRAVREGGQWVINGTKHFITRAAMADLFLVIAVTDPQKRAFGGITAFLVERGTPGLEVARVQHTLGGDLVPPCEVVFENCRVPEENVVGELGYGFATAMKVIDDGRLGLAAVAVGAAERLLEQTISYAKERMTFGKPLAHRQLVQAMIADSAMEIYAARQMVRATARRRDAGLPVGVEAAMTKVFASEMVGRVADRAFQVHGGSAYMRESPIGKAYATVRVLRIVEGASEILRVRIARELLRE